MGCKYNKPNHMEMPSKKGCKHNKPNYMETPYLCDLLIWRNQNLISYNHSKNKLAWCDVKGYKRFENIFFISNWF